MEGLANARRGPWRTLGAWARRRPARLGLLGVGLAYLGLLAFPGVLFAHEMTHGRFRVASDAPIDPRMAAVLDRAAARLAASPIDDPAMVHRVYLCTTGWRRALLVPLSLSAYAATQEVLGYTVVLGRLDVAADRIERGEGRVHGRSLSGVLAHERTHALLHARFGLRGGLLCPSWKKEGYCDLVAGDTSMPTAEALRLLREGRTDADPAFRYARACLLVRHALEVEGRSVDALILGPDDEDALVEAVRSGQDGPRGGRSGNAPRAEP